MTMADYHADAAERFSLLDLDDWGPADRLVPPVEQPTGQQPDAPEAPDATDEIARDFGAVLAAPVAPPEPIVVSSRPLSPTLPTVLRETLEAARTRNRQATETPGQRDARQRAESERRAREALDGAIRIALASTEGTYPHGCLVAWRPTGEVRWETVASAAIAAGVDLPAKRSARLVASEAVRALVGRGLRVDTLRRGSSWAVYQGAKQATVGSAIGETRLVATLAGDDLTLEGPEHLAATVRAEWERARAEATLTTSDVSLWLTKILTAWRAVPTAYGRWLSPAMAERWCTLAYELSERGISIPRRPAGVASLEDVADEIRAGLINEVESALSEIAGARERMAGMGTEAKPRDLGPRAAIGALADLDALRAKLELYEAIAGPMAAQRDSIAAMVDILRPLAESDPVAQRGAVLEMD